MRVTAKTSQAANSRKNGRITDGRFTSGNPSRPRGAMNKATLAVESLLAGQAERLTKKAIEKALEGDSVALRLCLDRIYPLRRDRTVMFPLPKIDSAQDLSAAAVSLLQSIAAGEATPEEGAAVMKLIEGTGKAIELGELEARISQLEERNDDAKRA
jgi:hypothetical protein